ncbi:P-loop containing nucleoside triphosphate hydrolase protein [Schizophyllum commune H4-8]|uniref:ABC transporter domain-containing protein n=1 Tax=Schizophyllum commune (strain H4-8 / FGSC 9210) TaxID=578458 RepID=D8PT01_SCHCM|nr:P-loop containing nucleoside triphosphate hydrolase protein [Schizophyllum commune H4-8]KAI5899484.1 P-loop containing nucleoside triphosphate hydrolase protein [Schizophyllum commune H4-8]
MSSLLRLSGVSCEESGAVILRDVDLEVSEGDVVVVQGRSGGGKTTLLKSIAGLRMYHGSIRFPIHLPILPGAPHYRTQVTYVPQRPSLLPGTPQDFVYQIMQFKARHSSHDSADKVLARAMETAAGWGVDNALWQRPWTTLSGGEAQRVTLAIALGLDTAEVLLLDEPTSALDAESTKLVEKDLLSEVNSSEARLKALVWITHAEEQARRVGTRFLTVENGAVTEVQLPPV